MYEFTENIGDVTLKICVTEAEGKWLSHAEAIHCYTPTPTEVMRKGDVCLNLIFSPQLMTHPCEVQQLKKTLQTVIEAQLHPEQKNQFFCVYAALCSVPGLLAKKEAPDFLRQLHEWFPQWVPAPDTAPFDRMKDSLHKEAVHWGGWKTPKKVNDWPAYIRKPHAMRQSKAEEFARIALEIFTSINQLVKDLRTNHSVHSAQNH